MRDSDARSPGASEQVQPDDRPLFASSTDEPRRRGVSIWFAAALSLVLGIVIGFASGYRAGQGQAADVAVSPEQGTGSTPTSGAAGQSFSESAVDGPVRLEEERIVPAPEPAVVGRVPPAVDTTRGGPAASAEAAGPGSVQVLSRPSGAQVILDGRSVGKTPVTIPDVSAGPHDVRLELPGFTRWATTVDVEAGRPTRVKASLEQ